MSKTLQLKKTPDQLQKARATLGDAGIPHTFHYSKGGFPYIRFECPHYDGEVSLQFRQMIRDRESKEVVREPHFLVFFQMEGGRQGTRSFPDLQSMIERLEIDQERIADGLRTRGHLSMAERVISVVDPLQEASYTAAMRR